MQDYIMVQLVYLGRIAAAGLCGVAIGWERQYRTKAAGVRTHFIISVAASLMMIISKYGFYDAIGPDGTSVDVSRVASGILAGVGLMSGGLVITGKQGYASGITTAAGIWATVAIGMSLGAGMYMIGLFSTLFLLLGHFLMHKNIRLARHSWRGQIDFQLTNTKDDMEEITSRLAENGIDILRMKCEYRDKHSERLRIVFAISTRLDREEVADIIAGIPHLCSYEF